MSSATSTRSNPEHGRRLSSDARAAIDALFTEAWREIVYALACTTQAQAHYDENGKAECQWAREALWRATRKIADAERRLEEGLSGGAQLHASHPGDAKALNG